PSREVIRQLEAVRQILSAARSGDLANDGETIAVEQAQSWMGENLPEDLRVFLDEASRQRAARRDQTPASA
ncbi:MAG: hypothetical protein KY475_12725, partial [Planctomycetes bacterium]|nr:hypothetical protein [Planctomycetota bacterium]